MVSEKYIVYNVNHHGSLFNVICLRYLLSREENVILILAESEGDYYSQKMLEERIFDKVITFRLSVGAQQEEDKLTKVLNDYFDDLLLKNGVSMNDITEIFTQADVINPFGIFAAIRGKKITIVEESMNRLSDMNKYEQFFNDKIISRSYRDLQKNLGILCGETDKYDLILYDGTDETRYFGFSHKRWSINYEKCYDLLTASEKDSILRSYCVDIEKYNNIDTVLFLNSDGYTESALDIKVPISDVYTTLADYCSRNGECFIIKPHPNSCLVSKKNFPDDEFIRNYPIEVINLIDKVKIKRTISAYTSAVKKIKRFVEDDISLGATFFRTFSHIHKLYVSLNIADFFANKLECKVFQNITRDCNYLNSLLKITIPGSCCKNIEYINQNDYCKSSVSIVFDAVKISSEFKAKKDQIIISFSPLLELNNYHKVKIALNDIHNGTNILTEFLYVFTGNDTHVDFGDIFEIKKILPRRGLKLEVSVQHIVE